MPESPRSETEETESTVSPEEQPEQDGEAVEDLAEGEASAELPEDLDLDEVDENTPLKEMVEYVARALTSNPDAVSVSQEDDGNRTIFHLAVDEKDKGKVIGRDGRVAQSIRALLRVAATKQRTRITLEID